MTNEATTIETKLFEIKAPGPGWWYRVEDTNGNVIGEIMTCTTGVNVTGWVFKIGVKMCDWKKYKTGRQALTALLAKHKNVKGKPSHDK